MDASFDLTGAFPFDRDAAGERHPTVLSTGPFLYIGRGYTASQFAAYVASYNFGRVPPDYLVLHHTAVPSTLAARYPTGAVWDSNEEGLSEGQVYSKRRKQLDAIAGYYQDQLGWDRGPHLFIDDRWIWLFTPMNAVGIHAKDGNSYVDADRRLHYSIGVEVLGYYEKVVWPDAVASNVRGALQALGERLGIALEYRAGPLHTPAAHRGSLSSHRDYNKPQCPGAAITEGYYTSTVSLLPTLNRYKAKIPAPIFQDRRPDAPLWGYVDQWKVEEMDDLTNGWLHCKSGIGFSPVSCWEETQ